MCVCLDHRMPRPEILLLYIGNRISVALAGPAGLEETLWGRVTPFQAPHPFSPRPHGRGTCLLALFLGGCLYSVPLTPGRKNSQADIDRQLYVGPAVTLQCVLTP